MKTIRKLKVYVLSALSAFFLFVGIISCIPTPQNSTGVLLIAFCAGLILLSAAIEESNSSRKSGFRSISKVTNLLGLVRALKRISELAATNPDIAEYLYKSGRCAVAHAYSKPLVDPDEIVDIRRLSSDMVIIQEIAENLMKTELGLSRSIIK